jgi:hypothetical protein
MHRVSRDMAVAGVATLALAGLSACGRDRAPVKTQPLGPGSLVVRGGTATLTLNRRAASNLRAAGITVQPLHPARFRPGAPRTTVLLPVAQGNLSPDTLTGGIRLSGGIAFVSSSKRIPVRELVINTLDEVIRARVGQARQPVFALAGGRLRRVDPRSGDRPGRVFYGSFSAQWHGEGSRAVSDAFGHDGPFAPVGVGARFATVIVRATS